MATRTSPDRLASRQPPEHHAEHDRPANGRAALAATLAWIALLLPSACGSPGAALDSQPTLRYVGSSSIAHCIRAADEAYGAADSLLDTAPESSGCELAIQPCVLGPESATRNVFRSAVLGQQQYVGCRLVRSDAAMLATVRSDPGAIGQIGLSFLGDHEQLEVVEVEGRLPDPSSSGHAITRPLFLLCWPSRQRVSEFIDWTMTPEGRGVLTQSFALPTPEPRSSP